MRQRPASVLVLAILSLFAGMLFSCCNVLSVASPAFNRVIGAPPGAPLTSAQTFMLIRYWVDLPVSLLLFVCGLGLLRGRPWGRRLGLIASALVVLSALWGLPMTVWEWQENRTQFQAPAQPQGAVQPGPQSMMEATLIFGYAIQGTLILLWGALGATGLVILCRPAAREYFSPRKQTGTFGARNG